MRKHCRLSNLDCANCAAKLEAALGRVEGVTAARVGFITQSLTLEFAEGRESEAEAAARALVRRLEPGVSMA